MSQKMTAAEISGVFEPLREANLALSKIYPGESDLRQPVHTVYGGAQLFKSDTAPKIGELAIRSLNEFAPDAAAFAQALEIPNREDPATARIWEQVYLRVREKLKREAVEDFRIDFEDGYGNRPDAEEDATAIAAAHEVAKGLREGTLPPFIGIRIKPMTEELKNRSIRTLDLFLSSLGAGSGGKLPPHFVVTLPKVTVPEQVTALACALDLLEPRCGFVPGAIKIEIMIETTQSLFDSHGRLNLLSLARAGQQRCVAAHFGTYDYTASCSITAAHQTMDHPACDFALHLMKVAYAGTGLWLSDGATSIMPVGKDPEVVHRAWRLSYGHVRHSLRNAFYQGWDLHPAQLPVRYAACYSFFLESLEQASVRLKNFMEKAAQATLVGEVFDDAATGQGLLNYFLRALNCGAITLDEVRATGLTLDEIRSRSFAAILKARRKTQG